MAESKSMMDNFPQVIWQDGIAPLAVGRGLYAAWDLDLGISGRELIAAVIHRIEYQFDTAKDWVDFDALAGMAVMGRNLQGEAQHDDHLRSAYCYDYAELQHVPFGAPAVTQINSNRVSHDFSGMPGGGLIVPARPLYAHFWTFASATAIVSMVGVYYTLQTVNQANYLDLIQTMLGVGIAP